MFLWDITLSYMYGVEFLGSPSVTKDAWPSISVNNQYHCSLDAASRVLPAQSFLTYPTACKYSIDFNFSNFDFILIQFSIQVIGKIWVCKMKYEIYQTLITWQTIQSRQVLMRFGKQASFFFQNPAPHICICPSVPHTSSGATNFRGFGKFPYIDSHWLCTNVCGLQRRSLWTHTQMLQWNDVWPFLGTFTFKRSWEFNQEISLSL